MPLFPAMYHIYHPPLSLDLWSLAWQEGANRLRIRGTLAGGGCIMSPLQGRGGGAFARQGQAPALYYLPLTGAKAQRLQGESTAITRQKHSDYKVKAKRLHGESIAITRQKHSDDKVKA